MEQWVELLVGMMLQVPGWLMFVIIVSIAYLENVIPPIPGDLIVVFGGYLAAEGKLGVVPLLIGTTITSTLGFMTLYELGSWWGWDTLDESRHKYFSKWLPSNYIDRAKTWMDRWGLWVVAANRFLAGTRSIISLTAGISNTPIIQTSLYAALSSLLWNSVLLAAGWHLSKNWRVFGGYLANYGKIILAFFAIVVVVRWFYSKNFHNPKIDS